MSATKGWAAWTKSLDARFPWLFQFVRFGIVGLSNTLISYLTYVGIVWIFALTSQAGLQTANFISFIVSVLNAYFWNTRWVFSKETGRATQASQKKRTLLKFFISYGGMYLVSVFLLYLWTSVLHIDKYVAPALTLLITVPSNFLINKFWTFRSSRRRVG